MEGRIVICFRASGGPGRSFLDRARALDARATACGGVVVAWGASRVTYAFEGSAFAPALTLAIDVARAPAGGEPHADEAPFAIGVAQGDLRRFVERGSASHVDLAWGPPVIAASALASAAQPGEILCADSLRALRAGELVTAGSRVAKRAALRIRGARLDARRPWRKDTVEQLAHMRVSALVGVEPLRADVEAGTLLVLRADPGMGGTRWLAELAAASPRALIVSPSGSGFEPLGALRRSLARWLDVPGLEGSTRELPPNMADLAEPLDALLAGQGISLELASRLVTASLWRKQTSSAPSLLLVDDAKAVDPATLEACVRAARAPKASFGLVVRLDATGSLPSVLATVPKAREAEIPPLSREAAEALAGGCTNEALDPVGRRRWARLGGNVPLGIVEAIAYGTVTGDVAWDDGRASPRSRTSGRGKVRPPSEWILLRARDESAACRAVLGLVAMLGGEARIGRLARILESAPAVAAVVGAQAGAVDAVVAELVRARWLVDTQEEWVGLPSRTHREALAALVDEPARKALHASAAAVIEQEEGVFGQVEGAWHAAQAGEGATAARGLLRAAKQTAEARLAASTTQLIAFARRADPSCEDAAMELLSNALAQNASAPPPSIAAAVMPRMESAPPLTIDIEVHDTEPPRDAARRPTQEPPRSSTLPEAPASTPGSTIANRLGELAKEALLSADNAALERWVDGLRAAGESPVFTDRMRAMARLGRGDIGDALRVLRSTRAKLEPDDHRRRCQTSLALGVALSVAGRPQEALLEGMDALARARQNGDERGAQACLAFLAKLYTAVERPEEAQRLRSATPAA